MNKNRQVRAVLKPDALSRNEGGTPGTAGRGSGQGTGLRADARAVSFFVYVAGFVLLYVFCAWTYGDVFAWTEQNSFVAFDTASMKHLTDRPLGHVYWAGRVLLCLYRYPAAGALLLAAILTGTAWTLNSLLRVPAPWRGLAFLLPAGELAYFVSRGIWLYYRGEPGIVFAWPLLVWAALGVALLLSRLPRRLKGRALAGARAAAPSAAASGHASGTSRALRPVLVVVVVLGGLNLGTAHWAENTVVAARMQRGVERADWDGMVDAALSVRRPSRTIAAYYAIALTQKGQLLERLFELPFDYPGAESDTLGGAAEQGNYTPDASFFAGLINTSNQTAMELMVHGGPRVCLLKRMALCSLLNGERALAEKYFRVLEEVPFESGFVERYRPMLADTTLMEADATLARVRELYPAEDIFSQRYRLPTFLGYNIGLTSGSNPTLVTSLATCLYSKDMASVLLRTPLLRTRQSLPICALQAIAIAARKQPELLRQYPEVNSFIRNEVEAFLREAAPYSKDKKKLRSELKKKWLGTYMYYYYCENNEGYQTRPTEGSGVN